jgi:hypothetical protein
MDASAVWESRPELTGALHCRLPLSHHGYHSKTTAEKNIYTFSGPGSEGPRSNGQYLQRRGLGRDAQHERVQR